MPVFSFSSASILAMISRPEVWILRSSSNSSLYPFRTVSYTHIDVYKRQHYTYVADRVDIPIILYNVPSRTGVNIKPQTYFELSKHPNIVATKEANGNLVSVMETINLCGDNLDIYSGSDEFIAPIMMLGCKGIISVMSNILPKETHAIAAACLERCV